MNYSDLWYVLVPPGLLALGLGLLYLQRGGKQGTQGQFAAACNRFQIRRPELEAAFFRVASASGKPRGLRWVQCQWSDLIEWVRDKQTGQLLALVGVTISFEAIEGGDMEGVEAVGNLRNASAVFHFQDGEWQTGGRAIFNLNPDEAVLHFSTAYERVVTPPANGQPG